MVALYDGGSCVVEGVHALVCSVLGLGGFVQLHLMACMAHLLCWIEGFTHSWEVARGDPQGCAGLPAQE